MATKANIGRRLFNLLGDWAAEHSRPPRILYHYTTAKGLVGMLETKRLWATNSRFMNDPTEIEYATELVRRVAISEIGKGDSKSLTRLKRDILKYLNEYEKAARVYVTCFCEQGDLLSQWRGYGAVGGGYAVGLLAKHLGKQFLSDDDYPIVPPILRRVIYQKETQERFVRRFVKLLVEANRERSKDLNRCWENFYMFLDECLNCYKEPAYEEEDEWRAIQYGRIDGKAIFAANFRENTGRIVPYHPLDFTKSKGRYKGKLPIEVARFGPTLEPTTTRRSLELLFTAYGYTKPPLVIEKSLIPFTG